MNRQKDDKLISLLHYMKGAETFPKIFRDLIRTRKQWCPFSHNDVDLNVDCYNSNPSIQAVITYLEKYIICARYLDCNAFAVTDVENSYRELSVPESMTCFSDFDSHIDKVKNAVSFIESDMSKKLDRFTCLECTRLDEAIECLINYCFYSSVVMAVSAVESRITEMVRRHDELLYEKNFEKATLGQLIQLFDENQYKAPQFNSIKQLIPAKHKPLVILLNQYRVFSAHPKEEKITLQIADAILKLSFTFMNDPETCPYERQELECK